MSFPMPGTTLALDLPNRGDPTRRLLAELEAVIAEAGGRIYAAKDAVMSAATYRKGYPELEAFRRYIDPAISSAFARRVELDQQLREAA
jgi:FAD/FMN-containing dehydrogenase